MPSRGGRLYALDLVRALGVAAVIVLLHSQGYVVATSGTRLLFSRGWYFLILDLALGLVTAVSAHVLAQSSQGPNGESYFSYMRRRVLRLWPLYAAALTFFVYFWFRDRSTAWLIAQYLCLGMVASGIVGGPVSTLWYVQLQFVYSAASGALSRIRDAHLRSITSAILIAFVIVWCVVLGLGDVRLALYVPSYLAGFLVARRPPGSKMIGFLAALSFFAGLAVLRLATGTVPLAVLVLRALVPALAYPAVVRLASIADGLGGSAGMDALARATFGAYLFHRPVLSGLRRVFQPQQPWLSYLTYSVLGLALSFIVGWVAQTMYDELQGCVRRRPRRFPASEG